MSYKYETYRGLRVAWRNDIESGGRQFAPQYLLFIEKRVGRTNRVYEFGAGAGFVAFALLAHGLCDSICLSTADPEALAALEHTVALNGLRDCVTVYRCDTLDGIPAHECWDLVVANLPRVASDGPANGSVAYDDNWSLHRHFYATVARYLKPHAQCILHENYRGSTEATFLPMLRGSGLEYADSFMLTGGVGTAPLNTYYFFCTRVQHQEIISADSTPVREFALRRDQAGYIALDESVGHEPLMLAVGQKYAFSVPGSHPDVVVEIRFADSMNIATAAIPYPSEAPQPAHPRRVIAVPTVPCQIADPASGDELIIFERSSGDVAGTRRSRRYGPRAEHA